MAEDKEDVGSNTALKEDMQEAPSHGSEKSSRQRILTEKGHGEKIRTQKNKQTAALAAVTKQRNEMARLMLNNDNLHLVKSGLDDYNRLSLNYNDCYITHTELLNSEDLEQEETRHETKEIAIIEFRKQVVDWVMQAEQVTSDHLVL